MRSWRTLFPFRTVKMAAVRFTLLVAVVLSLMFLATPLNAAASGAQACHARWVQCVGIKHEQCNECVDTCSWAAMAASGNSRLTSRMRLKHCGYFLAKAGTR